MMIKQNHVGDTTKQSTSRDMSLPTELPPGPTGIVINLGRTMIDLTRTVDIASSAFAVNVNWLT